MTFYDTSPLKYFLTFCGRFHCKHTFIEPPNILLLISNTSSLFSKKLQSRYHKKAYEIIKPPLMRKVFMQAFMIFGHFMTEFQKFILL